MTPMFSFLAWATMLLETVGRCASGRNGRDRGERTQDAGGSLGSFGRDHWPMWALWRGHGPSPVWGGPQITSARVDREETQRHDSNEASTHATNLRFSSVGSLSRYWDTCQHSSYHFFLDYFFVRESLKFFPSPLWSLIWRYLWISEALPWV